MYQCQCFYADVVYYRCFVMSSPIIVLFLYLLRWTRS